MSNMADAAAARREARRRKILENSHSRLQIISGKSHDECPKETPIKTIIPEPDNDIAAATSHTTYSHMSQPNGVILNQSELLQFLSNHDNDASGDREATSQLTHLLSPTRETAETPAISFWEKISTHKYDVVLLSLFIQILYSLSLISFDKSYFFLPVIVYIVTKMIWFPTQPSSSIANVLMLLNGMSTVRIQRILFFTQCFGTISCDLFIYLFTTISVQSLILTLRDYLVT